MSRDGIERAARTLADGLKFSQGALARNKLGKPTCFSRGKSFDILGAILTQGYAGEKGIRNDGIEDRAIIAALVAVQLASVRLYKMSAEAVNDTLGHEAVMKVMRLAWKISDPAR